MSESEQSSAFGQDWLKLQQEYWNAWWKLSQQATRQMQENQGEAFNPFAGAQPWSQAMDMWWKAVAPMASPENQDMFQRFLDQGKGFFQFQENFLGSLNRMAGLSAESNDWQKLWQQTAEQMKDYFSKWPMKCATPGNLMGCWELPLDNWQRTVSSLSVFPGDFLKAFKPGGMEMPGGEVFQENIQRLLSVPGVGYTREWQEQIQEVGRLWLQYQEAQQEYTDIFKRLGNRMVDRLGEKLSEASKQGNPITGLRPLYDLWVDSGEDVYAELVSTEEYAKINARLVNTLMAWKRHSRTLLDEMLDTFDLPTRRELDTVHRRLQQMRRETKALHVSEANGSTPHVDEIMRELHDLREEVQTLKAAQAQQTAAGEEGKAKSTRPARKPAAPKNTGE